MFARTPRLLLRPGWQEDAQALHAAMADEGVVRNLARAPWPYSLSDAETFLSREPDPRLPMFLAFNRTQGRPLLIGGCGIGRREDDSLELGYWVARPYWGLGFATEATRAVMRIARATGLTGIGSSHFVDNPASGRVMRKLGFRPTGTFVRRFSAGRGEEVLAMVYEDTGESDMRGDVAFELYGDAAALAAA
ncbi:MAG: GNAT family N-acetyltransferase [Sphingobium sp.]|nr:GNAT family N-acetyltransferase [Sphingobium sp.]